MRETRIYARGKRQQHPGRRHPDREPDVSGHAPDDDRPDPASTPIESGTLRVYNWDSYMYKKVLAVFEDQYKVKVEWTTFNNMEEGIQKLVAGQVQADVFFPTTTNSSLGASSRVISCSR